MDGDLMKIVCDREIVARRNCQFTLRIYIVVSFRISAFKKFFSFKICCETLISCCNRFDQIYDLFYCHILLIECPIEFTIMLKKI